METGHLLTTGCAMRVGSVAVTLVTFNVSLPVLVMVNVVSLVDPVDTLLKSICSESILKRGCKPVPQALTVSGEEDASLM